MRKVFVAGVLVSVAVVCAFASDTVVEDIIARVNNSIITRSELQRQKEQALAEARQQGVPEDKLADVEKNVLRDLVDQQLLTQKASELGLNADTEVVKRLDEIRKQMNLPDMEAVEKAAQQQ